MALPKTLSVFSKLLMMHEFEIVVWSMLSG